MAFLRRHTDRPAKITLPGPFTMSQQAKTSFIATMKRWSWTSPSR